MAAVNVLAVRVLNNPAKFTDLLEFEIEYEAITNLEQDLVWKLVYVGSAESDQHDQQLENVEVGPVTQGNFKFVLQANPPNPALIPPDDIVGVTVILLTCSYRDKEFIRVGYYVNNEYLDEELRETPPEQPLIDKLHRSILEDHPRVTRFPIPFDESEAMPAAQEDMDMDGGQAAQEGQPMGMDTAVAGGQPYFGTGQFAGAGPLMDDTSQYAQYIPAQ